KVAREHRPIRGHHALTALRGPVEQMDGVSACALTVAFDLCDGGEVLVADERVATHLTQVLRSRLGQLPRLVDAAEHRQKDCSSKVRCPTGAAGVDLFECPQRLVCRSRAEN